MFDLPEVRYRVTEHQLFAGQCANCQRQLTTTLPDWVPSVQMDAGLVSTIIQLSGQFHLSIRQIHAYLSECWHLEFSIGAISQPQGKANELLGEFTGYLMTDHHSGYNDVPVERRQLCWAHLIRHFTKISERNGLAGEIGKRLLLISAAVVRTRHRQLDSPDHLERYQRRLRRLRQSFSTTLLQGTEFKLADRTRNQCVHLLKDEAMCWTFLKDLSIPLTNNLAERAIRPYVIWRKLSYASQSSQGDQFRPMILSIIGTTRCLGIRTSDYLRNLCNEGLRGDPISKLPLDKALQATA